MSANTSLAIRIAAIFDNKGLKEAGKEVKGLQSAVKKLAGAAGIGLSTAAVVNFGKQAAKAFITDQKAASQLALSVKNLGLAFETPRIEEFISQLSKASGVADDLLRPSMQKLLQTTGSVAKSTELLTQALDISRGSGIDYQTVVNDLTLAYVGQTRGLSKYRLGLSKTELQAMSFAQIQEKLAKSFTGANAAYLETYAGKLGILSTAAGEAQEIIGKGLVESLSLLAGEGNTVQPIADSMQELATYVSDVTVGLATLIAKVKELPGMDYYLKNIFPQILKLNQIGQAVDLLRKLAPEITEGMGGYPSSALGPGYIDPNEAARKKAEAAAVKRAKELASLQKKTLDTQKKQNALTKASQTLDLERIGIAAALQGQISETDRLSLNLQLALLDKNDAVATKLAAELELAIQRQNMLQAALLATPEAPNPYRNWKIPDLGPLGGLAAGVIAGVNPSATAIAEVPAVSLGGGGVIPDFNVPANAYSQVGPMGGLAAGVIAGVNPQPVINVVVEVAGEEVAAVITQQQTNKSLSGSFVGVNRTARFGTRVDEG
jgi:hypothetical protein